MNAKETFTAKNALVLLVVGLVMQLIPVLAPYWFPPTGVDGSNASAIWLTCMGIIEASIGAWYLMKLQVIPALIRGRQRAAGLAASRTQTPGVRPVRVPATAMN